MADPAPPPATAPAPGDAPGFPFATVLATLGGFFLFLALVLVAYYSPNYLGEPKSEPKADPVGKLNEVRAKNQAVLDGKDPGVKLSLPEATAEVLGYAEKSNRLPFPVEPAPKADAKAPPAPAPKGKDDK
jgi:hypothetical protein